MEAGYHAPAWLPGGHAQTIWAAVFARRFAGAPPGFVRERWFTPDGDFIDLDWLAGPGAPQRAAHAPGAQHTADDAGAQRAAHAGGPQRAAHAGGAQHTAHAGSAQHAAHAAGAQHAAHAGTAPHAAHAGGAQHTAHAGSAQHTAHAGTAQHAAHAADARRTADAAAPLLVLFHGLEGSSRSHYAQAFGHWARTHGWRYVVPHFRGCSGEINLSPRAYHSGDYEEVGWILARLRERAHGPLVAVGVSLGGNALLRWAEEAGQAAARMADAVAAVCSPVDLAAGGMAIGRGFNRVVYTRMFLRTMVPKALAKLAQHPGLFDRDRLLAARDLYAFDDVFTAPLHGFAGTMDYWTRASAKPHLHRIRIPALVMNARNDPFVPAASLPSPHEAGGRVTLWQPATGGHVGFPAGRFPGHVLAMPQGVMAWATARL